VDHFQSKSGTEPFNSLWEKGDAKESSKFLDGGGEAVNLNSDEKRHQKRSKPGGWPLGVTQFHITRD